MYNSCKRTRANALKFISEMEMFSPCLLSRTFRSLTQFHMNVGYMMGVWTSLTLDSLDKFHISVCCYTVEEAGTFPYPSTLRPTYSDTELALFYRLYLTRELSHGKRVLSTLRHRVPIHPFSMISFCLLMNVIFLEIHTFHMKRLDKSEHDFL